jgi:hypothetical protein
MKRLLVQEAFVGEPDPEQEGLAASGEQDEAIVLRVERGQLVLVVPPNSPAQQEFESPQFLALELTLEDGRTLTLGVEGDAIGAYVQFGRLRAAGHEQEGTVGLSTVWPASA